MDYYKELELYQHLENSIDGFGRSLEEKKSGCFHHRVENILSRLLKITTNKTLVKNKILNHIEQSGFNEEVKGYLKHTILVTTDEYSNNYVVPDFLKETVEDNKLYDIAMVEGYKNFEESNKDFVIEKSFEYFEKLFTENQLENVELSDDDIENYFTPFFENLEEEIGKFRKGKIKEKEFQKYCKKKFLRFLNTIKNKNQQLEIETDLKKGKSLPIIIESAFSFMQYSDPRKHRKILADDDFEKLIKWINFYFQNDFKIPEIGNPINNVNTSKGNVVYTFIKVFKELHPTKTRPDSLFEFIKKCFYPYRNDNINNYKKQKEPQYYSELINRK